jgi:hypothetical protein
LTPATPAGAKGDSAGKSSGRGGLSNAFGGKGGASDSSSGLANSLGGLGAFGAKPEAAAKPAQSATPKPKAAKPEAKPEAKPVAKPEAKPVAKPEASKSAAPSREPTRVPKSNAAPKPIAGLVGGSAPEKDVPELEGDMIPGDSQRRAKALWQPRVAAPFQIILSGHPETNGVPVAPEYVNIFDLDLFNTPASTIQALRTQGKRVICYFSAGSSEDWRPDFNQFSKSEMGGPISKDNTGAGYWPGEKWLNIKNANPNSQSLPNVWKIMRERIKLAHSKGCDGIDPDNTGKLLAIPKLC